MLEIKEDDPCKGPNEWLIRPRGRNISEHKAKGQKMKNMKVGVLRNNSGLKEVPWKASGVTERDQPLKA